nr:hypothetical protein [Tanacetum cinerariifolium]
MVIDSPYHSMCEELASLEKTASGKDVSNLFMVVKVCQKPLGYFSSPMIHVPRAGPVIHPPGPDAAVLCPAVFGVHAGFLIPAGFWLLPFGCLLLFLFRSCCWNNDAILKLTSEDLSRILKLTLSNSRLGEDG